jgi:hypothetical protein
VNGRRYLEAALALTAALAAALAALPWLRAYEVQRAPLFLVLAAVLPVLLSATVTRWLRFGSLVAYCVSGTGLVALVVATNSFDFSAVWSGVSRIPSQLLTETLPLGGGPHLLVAPMTLVWVGAAASAELLMRPARPSFAGLAVPLASFVLAFAATTSAPPGSTSGQATALFAALALGALARQALVVTGTTEAEAVSTPASWTTVDPASAEGRRRPRGRAFLAAVLATGLASALAYNVPSAFGLASKPSSVTRPTQLLSSSVTDPVSVLSGLRYSAVAGRAIGVLSVKVNGRWSGYVSVAILDSYDGGNWSFTSTFRPTGGRVPAPAGESGTGLPGTREIEQQYTLKRPIGLPFLPAIDRPLQVDGIAVDADSATGMLVTQARPPLSYRVISAAPALGALLLPSTSPLATGSNVPGGDRPSYTSLPPGSQKDVAAAVRFSVNLTHLPASPSFAFLQDLAGALRSREHRLRPAPGSSAPTVPGSGTGGNGGKQAGAAGGAQPVPAPLAGTSLAQVINAVTVSQAATPEQFATFFAAVARYLGVPVRLVVGFRAPAAASGHPGPLSAGTYQLTSADAWAWDELPVAGYGWVVVDPTPLATTTNVSIPPEPVQAAKPTKTHQATALPSNRAAHALAKQVHVSPRASVAINWAVLLGATLPVAFVLALLAGFLGTPALRRRLRRLARHQADDPALLAAGAWLELLDGLSRLGIEVASSATCLQVVDDVTHHFGDQARAPAHLVGNVADQALYSARWPVDEERARLAWTSQQQLYGFMRRSVDHKRRLRSLMVVGIAPARPSVRARLASDEPTLAGESRSSRSTPARGRH